MRHFILVIVVFCFALNIPINAHAQHHYIPIPGDSAFWIKTVRFWESPGYRYFVNYTDGVDTVVAGNRYQGYSLDYPGGHYYGTLPAAGESWFRQDTTAKKVWRIIDKATPESHKELQYDFSIQVGDTLTDTTQYIFYSRRPYKFWVADMDSVYLADNLWHYRWFIKSDYGPDWGLPAANLVQIEGMGYTTGFMDDPLYIYDVWVGESVDISCFQHNGLWLFSQPNPWHADCDTMISRDLGDIDLGVGIKVPDMNELNRPLLYPNPAASGGRLTLNSFAGKASEKYWVLVFNPLGNEVFRKQLQPGQSFSLPYLPEGMYFFKIADSKRKAIYNTKIFIK